jgi:hypothetical protein
MNDDEVIIIILFSRMLILSAHARQKKRRNLLRLVLINQTIDTHINFMHTENNILENYFSIQASTEI